MNSLDLSGALLETDLEYIRKSFVHGDVRNGVGLYRWAIGFADSSSISGQVKLLSELDAMALTAGTPSTTALATVLPI